MQDAKPFTDSFVHRLVEVGTFDSIEADVSAPVTPEIRSFQMQLKRDGARRVAKKGVLSHDCPPAPAVGAGKDCFVYVLAGSQVAPIGVKKLVARFRVWPAYQDGSWQVINYDYALLPPPD